MNLMNDRPTWWIVWPHCGTCLSARGWGFSQSCELKDCYAFLHPPLMGSALYSFHSPTWHGLLSITQHFQQHQCLLIIFIIDHQVPVVAMSRRRQPFIWLWQVYMRPLIVSHCCYNYVPKGWFSQGSNTINSWVQENPLFWGNSLLDSSIGPKRRNWLH